MIRTKKALKLLTKKEQKHLTEYGIHSMVGMIRQIDFMRRIEEANPDNRYYRMAHQCWDCYMIGKKLGLIGE